MKGFPVSDNEMKNRRDDQERDGWEYLPAV